MSNPNLKPQIQPESDHPETPLAGDANNEDMSHVEASVLGFLDRSLPLPDALDLCAEAFNLDLEIVASAIDQLVLRGHMSFEDGLLCRAVDKHADDANPLSLYREWLAIYHRHPEWRAKLKGSDTAHIDLSKPQSSVRALRDSIEYDPSSVKPEDQEEFQHFLDLDRQIETYEDENPPKHSEGAMRQRALYRMAGGISFGIGIVKQEGRLVFAANSLTPNRGDIVMSIAREIAENEMGSKLDALPLEKQQKVLSQAESEAYKRYPLISSGAFDDGTDNPPAPDPAQGVTNWEEITTPDGKKTWRAQNNPNITLNRPNEGQGGI